MSIPDFDVGLPAKSIHTTKIFKGPTMGNARSRGPLSLLLIPQPNYSLIFGLARVVQWGTLSALTE